MTDNEALRKATQLLAEYRDELKDMDRQINLRLKAESKYRALVAALEDIVALFPDSPEISWTIERMQAKP